MLLKQSTLGGAPLHHHFFVDELQNDFPMAVYGEICGIHKGPVFAQK
jgi:hypothetical protein